SCAACCQCHARRLLTTRPPAQHYCASCAVESNRVGLRLMSVPPSSSMNKSLVGFALIATALSACGGPSTNAGGSAASAGRGAMPPMPVEMVTLEPKPVEQTSDYVGTVKSRLSASVQPQVEGYITRIFVKSGDHVNKGAPLMEIDARTQEAQITSLESVRAQREIDLQYARQESDRQSKLLAAGAASQMDYDRAANAVKAA